MCTIEEAMESLLKINHKDLAGVFFKCGFQTMSPGDRVLHVDALHFMFGRTDYIFV